MDNTNYDSKHTGPEIDAAIDRAKEGGEIDTLLAGKANISTQQTVEKTGATSRTVNVSASELKSLIDALPRLLTENLTIFVSGTVTEIIRITGFYGCGSIRLDTKSSCTFQKVLYAFDNDVAIRIRNMTFSDNADVGVDRNYNALLGIANCDSVSVENCTFTGTSNKDHNAVSVQANSHCEINTCTITNCKNACYVVGTSIVQLLNTTASGNVGGISIYWGGIVILTGSTANTVGGASNSVTGGLIVRNNAFVS